MTTYQFKFLNHTYPVNSEPEYNLLLKKVIALAKKQYHFKLKTPLFNQEIKLIKQKLALSEPTVWGGVNLKLVDVAKNKIRKLLVIKKYGILGFEVHKAKIEKLNILEGKCLMIHSQGKNKIGVNLVKPGDKFKFLPGDEHGVIALTNCVIEEQSTNHLDDLIFIYNSQQII